VRFFEQKNQFINRMQILRVELANILENTNPMECQGVESLSFKDYGWGLLCKQKLCLDLESKFEKCTTMAEFKMEPFSPFESG
jgi:hypothetical protein